MAKRYTFRLDSLGWFDCDQGEAESDVYVLASDFDAVDTSWREAEKECRQLRTTVSELHTKLTDFGGQISALRKLLADSQSDADCDHEWETLGVPEGAIRCKMCDKHDSSL